MPDASKSLSMIVERELGHFRIARDSKDVPGAWRALERAHIVSQLAFGLHVRVHSRMLLYAIERRDFGEACGQLFRLALVPIGHAIQRLPAGNTGRSDVSAFTPMPVPDDLAAELQSPSLPTR